MRCVQHVVVVVPVDADVDEAEHVHRKCGGDGPQGREVVPVGDFDLEDHDRDDDGEHSVTERLEPALPHRRFLRAKNFSG